MPFTRTLRGKTPIRPRPDSTRIGRRSRAPRRAPARAIAAAFVAACAAWAVAGAAPPAAAGVVTTAQDLRGATFEVTPAAARFDTTGVDGVLYTRVTLPDAVVVDAPGRPALPTIDLHVAVPDGMSPRLRVTAEQWGDRAAPPPAPIARETFLSDDAKTGPVSRYRSEPEAAIYRGAAVYPVNAAEIGGGALVGATWVVPVHVHPVRWDPRAGAYRVLRSMTLRVDFVPATDQETKLRPAARPGAAGRAWDRVLRGLVRNYETARAFPIRLRAGALGAAPGGAPARSAFAANPEWKLSVAQTGWASVSYATLAASGFPSGIAIANVTVQERGYDDAGDSATVTPIPVVARDANTNGLFDAGDAVAFYARSLRDRVGNGNIENRYADANVYWLTYGAGPAPAPGTVSGVVGGSATVPASYQDVIRLDVNQFFSPLPNSSATTPPEAIETNFWTNGDEPTFSAPIPFQDPDPSQPFRIRSRYQGRYGSAHLLNIFFQGAGGVVDTIGAGQTFFDNDVLVFDSGFTIPGSLIGGANLYRHDGQRQPPSGPLQPGSAAYLDVVEATYQRLYKAVGNALRFTSGGSGGVFEPHVSGFTSAAVEVYDVTDPIAPLRVTGVTVTPNGATFDVSFQTDATAGVRRFAAFVPGTETALTAGSVVADTPSALRAPGAFPAGSVARSIVVAPEPFLTPAIRLADYRRSQGYVVEVAAVQDVYDEFNGGVKSPRAIRRYLRHAYRSWTPAPAFVVLAGDASIDYRHVVPTSGVDWVPTYLQFETIPGPSGYEEVAHDEYYAFNLNAVEPQSGDLVPSLSLGRIPAGTASELDAYVTKVIQYETFQPTDAWRGRQLLVSDDEYSTSIFFNASYCFQPQESEFQQANVTMAAATASSLGGADMQSEFFNLKDYTDSLGVTCASPGQPGCRNPLCILTGLRSTGGGASQFQNAVSRGSLLLNIEAHANRYLLTHETLFCGAPNVCGIAGDYDGIANFDRPSFLMIWGCHTNQFPDGPTGPGATDSTDALGEQWMLLPNRGSIASFGSSGYEYLQNNSVYNGYATQSFYGTPPTAPDDTTRAEWIVGEVMTEAAIRNALSGTFQQQVMNRTLNLLGDPMIRMDALPPRIFQVTLDGTPFTDNGPLTSDSPSDSLSIVADMRDEVAIVSASVDERDVATGAITPVDSTLFAIAYGDSGRQASLTGKVRPHVGNYDLRLHATDGNGRVRTFTMQVRTPIKYFANGVEIVNNVFVSSDALLRAEVVSPIPVTADSLVLLLDGVPVSASKTQTDAAGRKWTLESLSGARSQGVHTIQVAFSGRTAGLDQRTFQITSQFTLRGVAVVDTRMVASGCGGSVFQYELSADARDVRLVVYTVAGRRVASLDLPGQAGFNVYCWNGRDSEGHEAATGLYLFRLQATDTSGRSQTRQGRFIRSR